MKGKRYVWNADKCCLEEEKKKSYREVLGLSEFSTKDVFQKYLELLKADILRAYGVKKRYDD